MAFVVGKKQYHAARKTDSPADSEVEAVGCAVAWPVTLLIYIIRAVFFEDWL